MMNVSKPLTYKTRPKWSYYRGKPEQPKNIQGLAEQHAESTEENIIWRRETRINSNL
jgi:hypothetical protein